MSVKREVSLVELSDNGKKFKVTLRIPEYSVSETKFFDNLVDAKFQFNDWC